MTPEAEMARFRKVDIRMWRDARFRRLSAAPPNAQTLWIHLLVGPQTGAIPGLYSARAAGMADVLGWPLKGFREAFQEVYREGMAKADWDAGLVWIPKAIKFNPPASPNVIVSWRCDWDELPECDLKSDAYSSIYDHVRKSFSNPFLKAFEKAIGKPCRNQEQEQEQEQEMLPLPDGSSSESAGADVRRVFECWVSTMGKSRAKLTRDRRQKIQARLREGYSVDDCCEAIAGCAQSPYHRGENDTGQRYDDLELILRTGSKLEKFRETSRAPSRAHLGPGMVPPAPPEAFGDPGPHVRLEDLPPMGEGWDSEPVAMHPGRLREVRKGPTR